MVVESLNADGSVKGAPDRFEVKDGEFGKDDGDQRSVASEITADHIQFVPALPGKSNSLVRAATQQHMARRPRLADQT